MNDKGFGPHLLLITYLINFTTSQSTTASVASPTQQIITASGSTTTQYLCPTRTGVNYPVPSIGTCGNVCFPDGNPYPQVGCSANDNCCFCRNEPISFTLECCLYKNCGMNTVAAYTQWLNSACYILGYPPTGFQASNCSSSMPSSAPPSGLSTGASAGIGVGVAIALISIAALVIVFCLRRRRARKAAAPGVAYSAVDNHTAAYAEKEISNTHTGSVSQRQSYTGTGAESPAMTGFGPTPRAGSIRSEVEGSTPIGGLSPRVTGGSAGMSHQHPAYELGSAIHPALASVGPAEIGSWDRSGRRDDHEETGQQLYELPAETRQEGLSGATATKDGVWRSWSRRSGR